MSYTYYTYRASFEGRGSLQAFRFNIVRHSYIEHYNFDKREWEWYFVSPNALKVISKTRVDRIIALGTL